MYLYKYSVTSDVSCYMIMCDITDIKINLLKWMINVCELKWLLKALTSIIIFDFHGRAIKIKRDEKAC